MNFCKATRKNPVLPFSQFHKQYSPYSRRQSTIDLIRKAYTKGVITGPILFINAGIDVTLSTTRESHRLFAECKKDKSTTLAFILRGYWTFFHCKHGASILKFHDTILPDTVHDLSKDILCITISISSVIVAIIGTMIAIYSFRKQKNMKARFHRKEELKELA